MKLPTCGLALLLLVAAEGCSSGTATRPAASPSSGSSGPHIEAIETPGLHNVFRLTDRLYSGSVPEGDEGFLSLQRLGVKTILSVDGARPDVERAKKYGLHYVHLPIGYDGVPENQARRLARAVSDSAGPVYIHCHHGKHRGPAAAGAALRCLDDAFTPDAAAAWLRQAGTDPRYVGLHAAVRAAHPLTRKDLDQVAADFPEVAPVGALAQAMVGVDERWDHLKRIRAAGWRTPPGHPDLEPAHEALQLAEQYREALRLPDAARRSDEFRHWLTEAAASAAELEAILRKQQGSTGGAAIEPIFRRAESACTRCHARYRDVPGAP